MRQDHNPAWLSAGREKIMANVIKASFQRDKGPAPDKDQPEVTTDGPLLDLADAEVTKMIKRANKRGYIAHQQTNAVLPSEEHTSEKIENILAMLNDMGINTVEQDEAEPDEEEKAAEEAEEEETEGELVEVIRKVPAEVKKLEPGERTDDPVRMYLREMGAVELLSREGEIAIAKRIEAGREAMIAGLCESPLSFQAIIIWRDELNEGKILLRDIIDLEATYEGPEAKIPPPALPGEAPQPEVPEPGEAPPEGEGEDEDDYENALSLAAMEAELKPKVLETFDNIAATYKKLRKLQDKKVEMQVVSEQFNRAQQKGYDKQRDEIIG